MLDRHIVAEAGVLQTQCEVFGARAGGELYVIPTYTAMLEVRELLAGKGGARHFWEGA